jgi:hypothetical protein
VTFLSGTTLAELDESAAALAKLIGERREGGDDGASGPVYRHRRRKGASEARARRDLHRPDAAAA